MISDRTATVIIAMTTGLWLLSILYGISGGQHTESLNGIFVMLVGGAIAFRSSRIRPQETDETYVVKYLERSKFSNWFIQKFLPSVWEAEVQMDIAWYDHKDDTAHHVVIGPEECPFCQKEAVSEASNIEPIIRSDSGWNTINWSKVKVGDRVATLEGLPDGTGIYTDSYGINVVTSLPEPEPQMSRKELWEFKQYVNSVPFMHYEEGDEILVKNMTGEVCVSYKSEDVLHCDVCPDKRPHYHDDIKVADPNDTVMECLTCGKHGLHAHDYKPEPLKVDVPEYDVVT
jgi:hypothetical protein